MRFIICAILFLGLSANAQTAKPVLISGFDDVLRQAENTGLTKAAIKILEKDKTFAGMPELYQAITREETKPVKFTLVSGIATWFNSRISNFLTETHYPSVELQLRNWLTQWSIAKFKVAKLEKIMAENPGRQFIVIFDNSQASLDIAEMIHSHYHDKIAPVYLHEVVSRPQQAGNVNYITALDIALYEMKLGRLSASDVEAVAQAILKEKNPELIIPGYAYCPVQYNPCFEAAPEVTAACTQVQLKIVDLCRKRSN